MENPMSWGKAEHVVSDAIKQAERGREEMRMGFSMVKQITNALRAEGLLVDAEETEQVGYDSGDGSTG